MNDSLGAALFALAVIVAIAGVCGLVGFAIEHRNDGPAPCARWADRPRDQAPSRCFGDFHPER